MPREFRFPGTDERMLILGRTGSGKTQLGMYVLARSPFTEMPYVMVDFKYDQLIGSIDRAREINYKTVPDKPGLYVIHPLPGEENELEAWLWKIWQQENIGLFFDEATLVPNKKAFEAILRQGRSKRIPLISLSQRPVDVPRGVYSESEHIAIMRIQDRRDRKTIAEFTPEGMTEKPLDKYHSHWYDIYQHEADEPAPYFLIEPVPSAEEIRELINSRLTPRTRIA